MRARRGAALSRSPERAVPQIALARLLSYGICMSIRVSTSSQCSCLRSSSCLARSPRRALSKSPIACIGRSSIALYSVNRAEPSRADHWSRAGLDRLHSSSCTLLCLGVLVVESVSPSSIDLLPAVSQRSREHEECAHLSSLHCTCTTTRGCVPFLITQSHACHGCVHWLSDRIGMGRMRARTRSAR